MATKKTAAPKVTLPYDRKLLTAWKNVGEKAVASRHASLAKVLYAAGTWEALAATIEAGRFPLTAVWNLPYAVADHVPTRYAVDVLTSCRASYGYLLSAYAIVAGLLGRALREDPRALDGLRDHDNKLTRQLVEVALAEAGVSGSLSKATRNELAEPWVGGMLHLPPLRFVDGAVENVVTPDEAVFEVTRETATRIFGKDVAAIVAAAHRRRLAEHTAVAGQYNTFALYPDAHALAIAAPALTPTEVCGFQSRFPELSRLSAAWTVDQIIEAAAATQTRNRPDSYMIVSSLAVLAIARDPSVAARAEPYLNLADIGNQASPPMSLVFESLMRTDAEWKRRWATDVVFAPGSMLSSVFIGPIAIALLASVDVEAARRIARERRDDIDPMRLSGIDPTELQRVIDVVGG